MRTTFTLRAVIFTTASLILIAGLAYGIITDISDEVNRLTLIIALIAAVVSIAQLVITGLEVISLREQFETLNFPDVDTRLEMESFADRGYMFRVRILNFHKQIDVKRVRVSISFENKRLFGSQWVPFIDRVPLPNVKADDELAGDLHGIIAPDLDEFVSEHWTEFVEEITGEEGTITRPILNNWSSPRLRLTVQYEPALAGKPKPCERTSYYSLHTKLWRDEKNNQELARLIDKEGDRFPLTITWELKEPV